MVCGVGGVCEVYLVGGVCEVFKVFEVGEVGGAV